jgi:hypothetical protein
MYPHKAGERRHYLPLIPIMIDASECSILCLNLARRSDRRVAAWQQFRRDGVVQRITAPDALPVEESRGWRNKGARACAAAHRLAWRAARKEGAQGVIGEMGSGKWGNVVGVQNVTN